MRKTVTGVIIALSLLVMVWMGFTVISYAQVIPGVVAFTRLTLTGGSGHAVMVPPYLYSARVSTNTTTIIKASPGVLGCVSITKAGSGGNLLTLYNGPYVALSGQELMVIDTTVKGEYCFASIFSGGLIAVSGTGTSGEEIVTFH